MNPKKYLLIWGLPKQGVFEEYICPYEMNTEEFSSEGRAREATGNIDGDHLPVILFEIDLNTCEIETIFEGD